MTQNQYAQAAITRLRLMSPWHLDTLKRELDGYDARTGKWKGQPHTTKRGDKR